MAPQLTLVVLAAGLGRRYGRAKQTEAVIHPEPLRGGP